MDLVQIIIDCLTTLPKIMDNKTLAHPKATVLKAFMEILRYWAKAARPYRWYFWGIYSFYAIGIVAERILIPIFYQRLWMVW